MTQRTSHAPGLSSSLPFILCGFLLATGTGPLTGQEAESPPPVEWSFESEVGASVFFGASDQTTVATKLASARRGPRYETEADFSFLYGEAQGEGGDSFVNKRSWEVGSTLNYRGFSWLNPYAFGRVLSSLEKRIDVRYNGGAGAKATVLDSEATRLDFALAVLAEKTVEDAPGNGEDELLARWTGSFRFRRSFSQERVLFETQTEYNPVFDQFDNFTVKSESSLAFRLSEVISLKLSLLDNYDSRAEDRGARSNNDGRVLFSVLASF